MPIVFRNLSTNPDDPVSTWPTEAILTALERGGIDEWRRIVDQIRRDPWGRTARQVEEVLGFSRPYGVADLMELEIEGARRDAESDERETVAQEVRGAIADSGLTRVEFASRIGTSTSRLSTYATGRVMPSASLMVRLRRLARSSRQQVVARRLR